MPTRDATRDHIISASAGGLAALVALQHVLRALIASGALTEAAVAAALDQARAAVATTERVHAVDRDMAPLVDQAIAQLAAGVATSTRLR